jgi:hypothetical protein
MKSPKKNNQAPRIAFAQLPFGAVQLQGLQSDQFKATQRFLLDLSTDTMLKPYRELAGLPAPGHDIGGWYDNFPSSGLDGASHPDTALANGYLPWREAMPSPAMRRSNRSSLSWCMATRWR